MDGFCKKLISYSPKNILSTSIKTDELELGGMKNSTTRELEYQAGRYCANKLLEDFGFKIDSNNKKELFPNWPKEIVGSISHCKGRAISAVANKSNYNALGIDLEKLNRLKITSLRYICHEYEIKHIGNNLRLATILFSLKEAIYKAQYPTYKYKLNFKDISLKINEINQTATIVWVSDKFSLIKDEMFNWNFNYFLIDTYVVVYCTHNK